MGTKVGDDSDVEIKNLERAEARARLRNLALERRKLAFELSEARTKRSFFGRIAEFFRVVSLPAALFGVLVTATLGINQSSQAQQARADDRLDKALSRLGSEDERVRMTGVSGLQLFIRGDSEGQRQQALHFLVDAAATETSKTVQNSIAAVFADLPRSDTHEPAMDDALETALDHSRSLLEINLLKSQRSQAETARGLVSEALSRDIEGGSDRVPLSLLAQLTLDQYLSYADLNGPPLQNMRPEDETSIKAVGNIVISLLKAGARSTDFSGIFCEECKFPSQVDYSGWKFDNAHIGRARFVNTNLAGASFVGAEIGGTNFYNSNLEGADLSHVSQGAPVSRWESYWHGLDNSMPLLRCANLAGAKLAGVPLASISYWRSPLWAGGGAVSVQPIDISYATIDTRTSLDALTVITFENIADPVLMRMPGLQSRVRAELPPSLLFEDTWLQTAIDRTHVDLEESDSGHYTNLIQVHMFDPQDLENLRADVREDLAASLDHAEVRQLALVRTVLRALGTQRREPAQPRARTSSTCDPDKVPSRPRSGGVRSTSRLPLSG